MQTIGIVGAGAWGTALAVALTRAGRKPILWAHETSVVHAILNTRHNPIYLPDVPIPDDVTATEDLAAATDQDAVLLAVPAQHLRAICHRAALHWRKGTPAIICAKGIEQGTGALMTEVVAAELPDAPLAILSGPTFAIEVARGQPTAITLASADPALAPQLVAAIGSATFRPYAGEDPIGVAIGGAVKNVLAIGCGVVEGKALGDNARAALITRGLAELSRLVVAKGGRAETCMGLSGLGDLVLTASSRQSRNYSTGFALGQGKLLDDIIGARYDVVEGVATAPAVLSLAATLGVDMPVCAAIAALIAGKTTIDETIGALLARPFKSETLKA
ncbi:MAG TPA: NAD(P)H-dependent glycerol-3-phosphate dehydrogenase [Magnetospirillaceae bacterium]|jgi:glycerol-3-phosphate dehydrogenase (NAD(P)+)